MNMIKISPGLEINPFNIINKRTTIMGAKNLENLEYVFCEELLKNGVPFCVVDAKGDFKNLKILYELLLVGKGKSDLDIDYCDFSKLAERAVLNSIPLIIDISQKTDYKEALHELFKEMLSAATEHRRPYAVILTEAEKYLGENNGIESLKEIALTKSGRGLGLIMFTSEPSMLDKNVLAYSSNKLLGSITGEENLKTVRGFYDEKISDLGDNEFILLGGLGNKTRIMPRKRMITEKMTHERDIFTSVKMRRVAEQVRREKLLLTESVKERLSKDEAKSKVKLRKKYVLFGAETEDYKSVTKVYKKVLQASIEEDGAQLTLLLNPETGVPYAYDNTLREMKEYEQLKQLTPQEIMIMRVASSEPACNKQMLKDRTGMNDDDLNAAISELLRKGKLNRTGEDEESYTASKDAPILNLPGMQASITGDTELLNEHAQVNEREVFKLVKSINPNAIIKDMKLVVYPYYRVEVASETPRTEIIDAVTGIKI